MPSTEILKNTEPTPVRMETYQLHPLGLLANYRDTGSSNSYVDRPGRNLWKGIVTGYTPPREPGAPALFEISGGKAFTHTEIAQMSGMDSENFYKVGRSDVQLRLEAEEDTSTLRAEVVGHSMLDSSAIDLAASLLQASSQIPRPFPNKTFEKLELKVFSKMPYTWQVTEDGMGSIIASPLDFDQV